MEKNTTHGTALSYNRMSARSAIISVVCVAMGLLSLIAAYNVRRDWEDEKEAVRKKTLAVAEYCADQQAARTMTTDILLRSIAMSQNATNQDMALLSNYLQSVSNVHPGYLKLLMLSTNGEILHFPGELARMINTPPEVVRNRFYFKEVMQKKKFVVGEYLTLAGYSQFSLVPMVYPLFDANKNIFAIMVAIFDLGSNDPSFKALFDNYSSSILFFDRQKNLAYRYPKRHYAPIGMPSSNKAMHAAMAAPEVKLTFTGKDPVGEDKTFAMVKISLPGDAEPYMYIVAATTSPKIVEFITSQYWPHLTATVMAFILSVVLAAKTGGYFFTKGLENLAEKTLSVKQGDFSIRVESNIPGCKEIAILAENMNTMLDSIESSNEKLKELSNTDELTGLYNRRHFYAASDTEIKRSLRGKHSIAVLMVDLDYFKKINDTYGHDAGDAVLRSFAKVLVENTRGTDLVARFGGEEFAIMLPETNREGALHVAEKLRTKCAGNSVEVNGKTINYTVSLGVCVLDNNIMSQENSDILQHALKRADEALYRSKEAGRNHTTIM